MTKIGKTRLGGAVLVAAGVMLGYLGVMAPLAAANAGAAEVSTSSKAVLVTPAFLSLGLLLVALPAHRFEPGGMPAWFADESSQRLAFGGYVTLGALLVVGVLVDMWVKGRLAALGYG
jgi:hypothetical protein